MHYVIADIHGCYDLYLKMLEKIGFSARHLSELIDNLLDLQELAQGSSSAKGEPVPLQEAIGQINAVYSFSCGEKGLIYQSSLDAASCRRFSRHLSRRTTARQAGSAEAVSV